MGSDPLNWVRNEWATQKKRNKYCIFFSFIRNHMGCELKHWTNVSSHMHHKKTNINNNNNECEREKNYHKCIHALKWKQSQMMNEMAEKNAHIDCLRLLPFVLIIKKTATTIYSSFVTIVFTVNLITDTQNIFFCLGLFVKSIIVYCLRMARCSRSACTHLSADWVWVTRYPKTGFEIII